MRVSVIIPNYNYADFLSYAIDSLLAQTEAVDEIIVVDDGSTDRSRDVIASYGDKVIPVFKENGGQASAMNAGFDRASGDIVCLLDSDDVFFPDKVKILKNLYRKKPKAAWIFHDLKHLSPEEAAQSSFFPRFDSSVPAQPIDQGRGMKRGNLRYDAPATSGLTFRKEFIASLFPLPVANSIYISDHYIKFYALARGEGINIPKNLGGQIIHGNNLYTGLNALATKAKIFVNTGYFLQIKIPEIKKFCTDLVAEGLVCAKKAEISGQVENIAGQYMKVLSPFELFFFKTKIALKLILRNIH